MPVWLSCRLLMGAEKAVHHLRSCGHILQKKGLLAGFCIMGLSAIFAAALKPAHQEGWSPFGQGTAEIPPELLPSSGTGEQHPFLAPSVSHDEPAVQELIQKTAARKAAFPQGVPVYRAGISAGFGTRWNPFGRGQVFHEGIDLVSAYGSPVYATANGVVKRARTNRRNGRYIVIDHGHGYKTLFAHLSRSMVSRHMKVRRGQLIGYLGSTGRSTGPHLHYGVYHRGKPVNPYSYMYDLQPTLADATFACERLVPSSIQSASVRFAMTQNCAQLGH